MSEPRKHTQSPTYLSRLREAFGSSHELLARSRTLLDDLNNVRQQSWKVIEESHTVLNKARQLTKY
jgi:hypothetical protein